MYIISKKSGSSWNHGLGCRQRDVKETLKRIEGETGRVYHEVGNESARVAPRQTNYDLKPHEHREIGQILDGIG